MHATKKKNIKTGSNLELYRRALTVFIGTYWPHLLVFAMVILSVFLRFYGLRDNLHFNIDETHHLETITNIYKNNVFVLKGPSASGGTDLYHGAYYYYLYLLPTWLSDGNPIALGIFTLLLNTLSLPILFMATKKSFNTQIALWTTLFAATSSTIIYYSRWAWNPNLVPFFFILAFFALAYFETKRPWWLALFAFSLSSISQLHIGAIYYMPIFFLMIPLFWRISKNIKVWAGSILALIIPWIPTIIYEAGHGWSLPRSFLTAVGMTQSPSVTPLMHITNGWKFFSQLYSAIIHLPQIILVISLLALLGYLIFNVKWRNKQKRLIPTFITVSLVLSFCSCAYYNGTLFVHYAEEFFIIMPLITALLITTLMKQKIFYLGALSIAIAYTIANWFYLKNDIINGEHMYAAQHQICQIIKSENLNDVEITINGQKNPEYIKYTCDKFYSINFADKIKIGVDTDFKGKFSYQISNNQL